MLKYLNELFIFSEIADAGSFTKAADKLHMSKSKLSKTLTQLEDALQLQLMVRTTRQLALTEAGHTILGYCSHIKELIHQLEQEIYPSQEQLQGLITVNAPQSFCTQHLIQHINRFMTEYPQMHIHLKAGALFHNMIGHNIDLAIRIGTLPDSSLKARLLTKSRVCVFGSPQYLKKHGTPQHPDDLTDHQCLRYENSPTGHLWEFTVDDQLYPITVNSPLVLNNSDTLVSAAEEHMGLIMLPEYILNKDKENGTLVPVLETYCKVEIPIYLVYPNVSHVCVRTRALMDFLINAFEHANTI